MKIKHVEPIAVSFPMKKPVFMAGVEIRRADNVLVRIEADNGVVGWGEAASAPTMTGETVESMMAAIGYLTPALEGRPAEDIAGALAGWTSASLFAGARPIALRASFTASRTRGSLSACICCSRFATGSVCTCIRASDRTHWVRTIGAGSSLAAVARAATARSCIQTQAVKISQFW